MPRIFEYFKQTAIIVPYANLTFVDPRGRLYHFTRGTNEVPPAPTETLPHPHGVDVETVQRMLKLTNAKTLQEFLRKNFQRIGETTARKFLLYAKLGSKKNPRNLSSSDMVTVGSDMKNYEDFVSPDATSLSPLGADLLATGIKKELGITDEDVQNGSAFTATLQRKPATYSGFPFIIEVGIASGKQIETQGQILLFRFANKIHLLFDQASDVSWKVLEQIDWRGYRVIPGETPLAVFVHVCSTKIPSKSVGKDIIANHTEHEHENLNEIWQASGNATMY